MESQVRIFRASAFWRFNVSGAILAGVLGALLIFAVAVTVFLIGERKTEAGSLVFIVAVGLFCSALAFFPGNLAAMFPTAVEVSPGHGVRLLTPFKELFIPIEDLKNVEESFLRQGAVVRFRKRYGLLNHFVVHWLFGGEKQELIQAIKEEMTKRELGTGNRSDNQRER